MNNIFYFQYFNIPTVLWGIMVIMLFLIAELWCKYRYRRINHQVAKKYFAHDSAGKHEALDRTAYFAGWHTVFKFLRVMTTYGLAILFVIEFTIMNFGFK